MTVIALYSMKGGVGKTAGAVNLAYEAAQNGFQTLLCDLDPQGAASFYFRIRPHRKFNKTRLLKGGKHVARNIRGTDYEDLDLLPATLSFRNLDLALEHQKQSKTRLKRVLEPLAEDYRYVFLDCPPNMTLLAENVFRAADWVVVPCVPTTLSMLTFKRLVDFYKKSDLDRRKLTPYFSMVERRKTMHREIMDRVRQGKTAFLKGEIAYMSDVERMGLEREPVACFKRHSRAARAYRALWEELHGRMEGRT